MSTFAIATLGCKVNAYESESYIHNLISLGYEEVDFREVADVYIINTCAVTNTASSKSRQKMNQAKRRNEDALICLVGCFVQTSDSAESLGVDVLIGSSHKDRLASIIDEAIHSHKQVNYVSDISDIKEFEQVNVDHFEHKTRAFLKIQDGCNQFCSYCIIPYARGRERSMPFDKVIKNANKLVHFGHKEIVLTGIHTGRYGYDIHANLITLLRELVKIDGLERIRISSIEMNEMNEELITFMRDNKKLVQHLHIPLQSGSNRILKAMHRPYDVQRFYKKLVEIREAMPTISISSDLILGFPDESEEDFMTTMQTLEDFQFSFLHVFPYSKRNGTKACELDNHMNNQIKKERCHLVSERSQQRYATYLDSFLHKSVEVLFEEEKDGYMIGHSGEYIIVKVKRDVNMKLNEIYEVNIVERQVKELIGEIRRVS